MIGITLYVSAPKCQLQGIYEHKGSQVRHFMCRVGLVILCVRRLTGGEVDL